MQRFMCTHTLPPGALTRQQVEQFSQATQHDPQIRGCESFVNLSEGKAVCILDAPDRQTLAAFFQKMGMPVDSIDRVELQGDHGQIHDAQAEMTGASGAYAI